MRIAVIGIVLVGFLATPGETEAYRLIGSGTQSCGTWTPDRRLRGVDSVQNEPWVVGFISGVADADERVLDPMPNLDAQAVYGWMDNYCQANPTTLIVDAAREFIRQRPR